MLTTRMTVILQELMGAKTMLTSEELASIIQVTSRTVRNDIKELDSIISQRGGWIRSIRGTGYELVINDDNLFREFLQENFQKNQFEQNAVPGLPVDRVRYIIKRLLLAEGYLKLEDLADELFISKSTIQNDFRDVKRILERFEIQLESRPNYGLKIKGDERRLRFCMSEYIFDRTEMHVDLFDLNTSILPLDKMNEIKETILKQIDANNITLSDVGLNNLVIHIAIAYRRIENGNYVSISTEELRDVVKEREYNVAHKIIQNLESKLGVTYPDGEIAYIAIHLLGTRMVAQLNEEEVDVKGLVEDEILELTLKILDRIEVELHLGIRGDKELNMALCLHLKPAVNRFRYGMNMRNPMINEIKSNYPIAFEAGIVAGRVILDEIGILINEHEIGFLALHFGAAMERREMNALPKRCLVVCASGMGSARLLSYKLQSKFGSALEVVGISELYKLKEQPLEFIDFVISTIPIKMNLPVPIIEVNTFLGEQDFHKIENRLKAAVEPEIQYLNEDLVFLDMPFDSKEEVLGFLSQKLLALGLVDESFNQSVLEREAVSPTSFGNLVAIPHPVTPQTQKTFWAVCTLQRPIDWGGKKAQLICLLCVEKNSNGDFQKMYELLGDVIDDVSKVQKLIKSKSYKEFIQQFLK